MRGGFAVLATLSMLLGAHCAGERGTGVPIVRRSPVTAVANGSARAPAARMTLGSAIGESTESQLPMTDPSAPITIAAVGDVMLARTIGDRIVGDAPQSPFAAVAPILRSADVAIANLECAVGTGGTPAKKAFTFRAPPLALGALLDAGIDVVSLANNHAMDFGTGTFAETLTLLDDVKIAHAGAGMNEAAAHAPAIVEARGYKVGFLGYVKVPVEGLGGFDTRSWEAAGRAPGLAWADPERIAGDVVAAKEQGADLVVVMIHSGFEQAQSPNIWQIAAAEAAIDAGASLVLGAHPHVLQGARRYKKGFIAYSLGNFVFDGTDIVSAILKVTLDREGVKAIEWTPVILRNGYPQLTDELTGEYVRNLIKGLSMPLGTD